MWISGNCSPTTSCARACGPRRPTGGWLAAAPDPHGTGLRDALVAAFDGFPQPQPARRGIDRTGPDLPHLGGTRLAPGRLAGAAAREPAWPGGRARHAPVPGCRGEAGGQRRAEPGAALPAWHRRGGEQALGAAPRPASAAAWRGRARGTLDADAPLPLARRHALGTQNPVRHPDQRASVAALLPGGQVALGRVSRDRPAEPASARTMPPDLLALPEAERDHWLRVFLLMFGRESFVEVDDAGRSFHLLALDEGKLWEETVARDLSRLVFAKCSRRWSRPSMPATGSGQRRARRLSRRAERGGADAALSVALRPLRRGPRPPAGPRSAV